MAWCSIVRNALFTHSKMSSLPSNCVVHWFHRQQFFDDFRVLWNGSYNINNCVASSISSMYMVSFSTTVNCWNKGTSPFNFDGRPLPINSMRRATFFLERWTFSIKLCCSSLLFYCQWITTIVPRFRCIITVYVVHFQHSNRFTKQQTNCFIANLCKEILWYPFFVKCSTLFVNVFWLIPWSKKN